MYRYLKYICVIATLCLVFCGCANQTQQPVPQGTQPPVTEPVEAPTQPPTEPPTEAPTEPPTEAPTESEPIAIRITATGDNLLHNSVSYACAVEGGYDFTPVYQYITDIIGGSDISFVNQEVMFTGEAGAYPNLAAPLEAADALIDAGFNVINLATNHTLDKGVKGLETCLETVHDLPFDAVLGAFRTEEESTQLCFVEKQGIRFGFLSYTYGLNGYQLPSDKLWKISMIDEAKIKADLEAIRPECDYLIVSMHWGNEYQTTQGSYQEELAQLLCDGGADLIIGTHPHVLQPIAWLENAAGHRTLCAYSLGNFVSNQHKRATMLGGILEVELLFDENGELLETVSAGVIPTVTHYQKGYYRIYPLSDYTDELAAKHGIHKYETPFDLTYLNELSQKILGEYAITWEGEHD
ncbi:MAG: CapA family protein [Clostridia bacterium]|nr:CapA family protein [Clostridia bacterium]